MKIVHVYARNLQPFVDAVEGTECRLNASTDIGYMAKSIQNFNARDVLGLVVFANPMTKRCLAMIQQFDELFQFNPLPIVVINDNVSEIYEQGLLKVKYSKLYLLDSVDNTISDVDVVRIFATVVALSGDLYDLSACPAEGKRSYRPEVGQSEPEVKMSGELAALLKYIAGEEQK